MSTKYKGVVIGCGRVGATFEMHSALPKPASHAAALQANPRTELVALVDSSGPQLKQATDYYQVRGYADPEVCIQEIKPDIVVIATPSNTHEVVLNLCIKYGVRAVICEKPVSDSQESAQRMMSAAKEAGVVVIINHQRRFFPLFQKMRERIAAGKLGHIQQITCYYTNGLVNNGTHTIDALHHLLGEIPAWVVGIENKTNVAAVGGPNIDGLVGFPSGTVGVLQSLNNDSYILHDFAIYGDKGAAFIRNYGFRFEYVFATSEGLRELDWSTLTVETERRSMMAGTTEHIVECLDGISTPQSTLKDGYQVMKVLDALNHSVAQGGSKIEI